MNGSAFEMLIIASVARSYDVKFCHVSSLVPETSRKDLKSGWFEMLVVGLAV